MGKLQTAILCALLPLSPGIESKDENDTEVARRDEMLRLIFG